MTMPDPDELDPTGELSAQIEAQRKEHGTYVATRKIYVGNALAADVGHSIPVSNVVAHNYFLNGQVALVEGAEHPPEVAQQLADAGLGEHGAVVSGGPVADHADVVSEPAPVLTVDRAEPGGAPPIDEEERI